MTVSAPLACQIDDYQGNRLLPWTSRRQGLVNPVTYSAGVDVAARFAKSKSDGAPSGWRRAIQIQAIAESKRTIDRGTWGAR